MRTHIQGPDMRCLSQCPWGLYMFCLGLSARPSTFHSQIVAGLCFWSARWLGLWNACTDVHLALTPSMKPWDSEFRRCLCRALDYWQGYKYFCYAYYSHSQLHEPEFRATKLGSCFRSTAWVIAKVLCSFLTPLCFASGGLLWRFGLPTLVLMHRRTSVEAPW